MFTQLKKITEKPDLYCCYTAETLWNDPYLSQQMLKNHLDPAVDLASRKPDFIAASVAFMQDRFNLGEGKSVLDFGCGPGLYTARWARLGCKVRGLDFSANSIAYARKEAAKSGLDIEYLNLNYLDYQVGDPFDLITMIFCDYGTLNDEQRKVLLSKMKTSLKDNGRIFMDVHTRHMYQNYEEGTTLAAVARDGFWSPQSHYVFKSTFKYDVPCVSLDKYTVIEKDRTREIYNWLKYYTIAELSHELEENGFKIAEVYSDVKGTPYDSAADTMAVIVGKKK